MRNLVQLKVLVENDNEGREAAAGLDLDDLRPKTRADCLPGGCNSARPCPWYGCRYHNGLDINEDTGAMTYRDVDELVHSCALDVAEIGGEVGSGNGTGIALEELGDIMGVTKERARQVELIAVRHLAPVLKAKGLAPVMRGDNQCSYCGGIDHATSKCKLRPDNNAKEG